MTAFLYLRSAPPSRRLFARCLVGVQAGSFSRLQARCYWWLRVAAGCKTPCRNLGTRSWVGTAGALFGGDGFDDEAAGLAGVDGLGGKFEGLGDEALDAGVVNHGAVVELDVAGLLAAAFEVAVGIAEAGAVLQEEEADPAREDSDREEGVGGAVGGGEADGQRVVIVVHEFLGAGQAGAHAGQGDAGFGGDLGSEFVEEGVELGGRGYGRRRSLSYGFFEQGASGLLLRGCGLARSHGEGMVAGESVGDVWLRIFRKRGKPAPGWVEAGFRGCGKG